MNIAEAIVERLGGTRKAAGLLALPPSTVQSWKASGLVPAKYQARILAEAAKVGIGITPADFFSSAPIPAPAREEAA